MNDSRTVFTAPMSSAQQRLWLLNRLSPESAAFNIVSGVTLQGSLDVPALQRSVDAIVARHETLRTFFREVDGAPRQLIDDQGSVPIAQHDLRHLPEAARDEAARSFANREAAHLFNLGALPLIRVNLLRLADDRYVLLSVMHHIISDGWSMGVFAQEVAAHYSAYVRGDEPAVAELPVQYADFAGWQEERLGDTLPALTGFWRAQLDGAPQLLELPSDRPRRAVPTYRGASVPFQVSADVTGALRRLGKDAGASLFMTLLAALSVVLYRHSRQSDICIGTPVSGRSHSDVEGLIGFFVNMLPLRIDLSGQPTFNELLQRVRATTLSAFANQEMPFDRLVAEVQPQRALNASPVFQVMLVLQNAPAQELQLPGLSLSPFDSARETTQFDLSLAMQETAASLDGSLEYSCDLFDRASAERLVAQFGVLLSAIASSPNRNIDALPLLTESETQELVSTWNATARGYDLDTSLPRLFEQQAARTPDAVAVVFEEKALTYRALNDAATGLASALRSRGVSTGDVVGVRAERSLELVIALYGIVKAGAAYCPLDPSYPRDRLAYMAATANAKLVLTQAEVREWCKTPAAPLPVVHPDEAAYVIFTSGSTGRPKGVMVSHRAIVNRLLWMQDEYGLTSVDAVLQKTTFSFDVSVWEFFWPLLTGATLVVARPDGHRDAPYLAQLIRERGVTVMHFVPSMLTAFLDEPSVRQCTSLRHVMCSGEALPGPVVDRFFARSAAALHNLYGPTEAAVDVTYWPCDRGESRAAIPIGYPIANIRMHVLDGEGQPCPVGVPGELMIGGVGLARGYISRPGLTAERFVPDPLGVTAGARLYRTGDRARYLAGGAIDFLGRLDHQIKLRGQRIELGEIENALATHPAVRACAVALSGDTPDDQQLVAYVVWDPAAGTPDDGSVRRHLLTSLPDYMVPSVFITLDAVPLSPTGKLDRRALPAPGKRVRRTDIVLPRTATETLVAAVWRDVLGIDTVDVETSFFELGGHSLRANQVIARLQAQHQLTLPLQAMFEAPTIAQLAARIDSGTGVAGAAVTGPSARPRPARIPLSYSQERLWFLNQSQGPSAAHNLSTALRLTGDLDLAALRQALSDIVRRHEILRTTFSAVDGVPFQVIHPAVGIDLPVADVSRLGAEEREAEVRRLADADALAIFDLECGPLMRVSLLRLSDREHVVLSTLHHIVFDGWSSGILARELSETYDAIRRGVAAPVTTAVPQYADYAIWQRESLTDDVIERELQHWRGTLANPPDALTLPADYPQRDNPSPRGALHAFSVAEGFESALQQLCASTGVTPFMVYLATYATLLSRYSGQDDIVIGSGIANREHRDTEATIGFFVNTLALRIDLRGNPSFRQLVERVRTTSLGAFEHARTPFHKVVEAVGAGQGASFYQTIFVLQNTPAESLQLGPLRVEALPIEQAVAKVDLILEFTERPGGLAGKVEYNAERFSASTLAGMMDHLQVLFRSALAEPDRRVRDLAMMPDRERTKLLSECSGGYSTYPSHRCVHELFEEQSLSTPDAAALAFGGQLLTYAALNARANQLAHRLQAAGVGPGDLVGVFADRSLELPIGLLGILKAGGAYVSFEVGSPDERLAFMLDDSGARVVLTDPAHHDRLRRVCGAGVELILLDGENGGWPTANPANRTMPDGLAYVSYTSGSTGRPKGVEITHRAVVRLVRDTNYAHFGHDETMLLFAPVSFDASTFEIWGALLNGGALVVAPPGPEALDSLSDVIRDHQVSTMWMTAGLFHMMVDERLDALAGLRQLVAGGDVLWPSRVRTALEAHRDLTLINGYGPTEGTTFTCCHRITDAAEIGIRVPIGRPIANTRAFVVDGALQLAPIGVYGELYIGGAGLARAYLRRPSLTAERFVPHPWSTTPGERLYRSGDRVRWQPDGSIEFVERIDAQVKIRGFRVDLGEIETHLRALPGVQDAVVITHRDAREQLHLTAYLIPRAGADRASARQLRDDLQANVPKYMLPSAFTWVDAFPLTENGKLDRRALPEPVLGDATREFVAPRSATETVVAAIWSEVLGGVRAGVHDDFFDLGGHSLMATQVIARLRQRFRADLPFHIVFDCPTVATLAEAIDSAAGLAVAGAEPREEFEL